MASKKQEVSLETFKRFEEARNSKKYDMILQDRLVQTLYKISNDVYWNIIYNYQELKKKYQNGELKSEEEL